MDQSSGFTLIELLVTVAIIGIIAATAIPQYSAFKKRAFDSRARTDLVNVAIAEEAYFLDAEKYLACNTSTCNNLPGISSLSKGVTLSIAIMPDSFSGSSQHSQGTGKTYLWDSNSGGLMN